jgi:hypothetical protein
MTTIDRCRVFQSGLLTVLAIVCAANLGAATAQENAPVSTGCPPHQCLYFHRSSLEWMGC